MSHKEALALADFLVEQTKPKNKVIIPQHLRFDGWLSTASQLRKSIMSTFQEMEQTKKTQHIKTLTILKLRISNPIIRILPTLISFCLNATSIKMELEYPSQQSIEFEMMHNRRVEANRLDFNDDHHSHHNEDDYNSLMVTEETVIKYMRQLFHTISYLPNVQVLFIRFIDFPLDVYKDYISMCFNLKATNYKSFPSLKSLTFPIDNNNIRVYIEREYWSMFKHFIDRHHLNQFTLLLDAEMSHLNDIFIQATTNLFNQFCNVFLPTLLNRKYALKTLGILAQSPMNVLCGNNGMCYSLIAPFFNLHSIHLPNLTEFNLYLPNTPNMNDMLRLLTFITESENKLIKFRLELPNNFRYKKDTKKLLQIMAKFVNKNKQLNELHFHVTKIVNNIGIKQLFKSIRNHPNLIIFEMSEIQINAITWNAFLDIFHNDNDMNTKRNTNLQVFKLHFKYKPWHKILENKKLNMSNNDILTIIDVLFKNQQYLYQQIKIFEKLMKDIYNMNMDIILILNSFIFNQNILTMKICGLSHEIKKKNIDCFRWFHELMFNNIPINNDKEKKWKTQTKEQLLYGLDWNILRSHVVKRQLVFK